MAPPRQQGLGWKIFWALGDATTQPCYKESSLTKNVGYKRIWVIYFTHFPIWRRLKRSFHPSQGLNLWRGKLKPILITTTWDSLSPHIKYWSLAVAYPSQITSGCPCCPCSWPGCLQLGRALALPVGLQLQHASQVNALPGGGMHCPVMKPRVVNGCAVQFWIS